MQRLLVIHNKPEESQSLEKSLKHLLPSSEIIKALSVDHGIEILSRETLDAVFIDYMLSRTNPDFLKELQGRNIDIPIVALIDRGREIMAAEAIKEGAYDYIIKDSDYTNTLHNMLASVQNKYLLNKKEAEKQRGKELLFEQITKSYRWWQGIIDAITDYLFVIDDNYNILRTNKAFANLFNKEPADIIMKTYYKLFGLDAPHDWCRAPKNKKDLSLHPIETSINEKIYLISSFPIFTHEQDAVVYIMKDVTETRRLKDQIHHLDKLSSLGTLASGVAHEINNPLTGIIGYTEMLVMKNDENELTKKYLEKIYDSAIRCKRIVENMLVFSRQTSPRKSLENINDIIDRTIELHEYLLKTNNIEIVKNYEEAPYLALDSQQMQQVISNLLINAEHAISETKKPGRIEIKTTYDKKTEHVILTITDNGAGISQEVIPKIFDPFFTTKPVNIGTGLGLSIVHGIITEQGGTITVESVIGKGTTFTITLPRIN